MNKIGERILSNFLFVLFLMILFSSLRLDALTSEVSKMRVRRIATIIRKFTDVKEQLSDPYVQEAIMDKVGQSLTLEPDEKPNKKDISDIARNIRKIVTKRFPDSIKKIKAKAEKAAKKKYKLKDKLEFVTVNVQRGGHTYKVSGVFYRFGIGGKSVVIGDHTPIAFIDLPTTDRAKFDATFCKQERKKYIDDKIRNYYKKKQSYLNLLFTEQLEKIVKENESLGYIYVWNEWRTPKNVTDFLIQQNIRQQEKDGLADLPDSIQPDTPDTTGPVASLDPIDISEDPAIPVLSDDTASLRLAKLKQKIEKWQMEIMGSQYGVDADQGFRKEGLLVLIGRMSRDEVNLLTGLQGTGDSATLTYPTGHIEKVTFHFVNNLLYKIETTYRIGPAEGMNLLLDSLNDAYGASVEEKEMIQLEKEKRKRLSAIKKLCPKDKGKETHSWKKGKCTKCGVLQADCAPPPPIALKIVRTWPGNIINAQLLANLNSDASNFTRFVVTKENAAIKAEQDEILKEKAMRKAEEEKRKRIDEYKNQLK